MKMNRKSSIKFFLVFIFVSLMVASIVLPIPYYIEQPGSTIDLKELITVNGQTDENPGSFSLTSVGIRQASVVTAIRAKFNSFQDIISEDELFGGTTDEEYSQMQRFYMDSSQNNAIEQALKYANRPYTFEYKGVYVMDVLPESNFFGKISVGDTVTKVDGHSFENNEEFMSYVQGKTIGDEVAVTFVRDNEEQEVQAKLIELPSNQKAGIGITLTDHTEIESEDTIEFHVENIGGPSAGLMFTLEIYEQLTGDNLRKGKNIAGTGTINSSGEIGRIGGIDKKIASASQQGVEVFFAPNDELSEEEKSNYPNYKTNYEEALEAMEKIDSDMVIVPVKTFQDALDYLENM